MSNSEKQVLIALRGKVLKSFDGSTITTVLWTDTDTGKVHLPREKVTLTELLLNYEVPNSVWGEV
jgi:hypothetical protein